MITKQQLLGILGLFSGACSAAIVSTFFVAAAQQAQT
jgi:hypothetical protein